MVMVCKNNLLRMQLKNILSLCLLGILGFQSTKTLAQCSANYNYVTNGFVVSFYKTNVDSNEIVNWNLDNGNTSTADSFTFIYPTEGIYNVCLSVFNNSASPACRDSLCKQIIVCNDCVWPGDVNADKIANNKDVLFVGLAYGLIGPARSTSLTTDFTPQFNSTPWVTNAAPQNAPNFNNGINFKHADCDGNGIVDEHDISIINQNFDLSYNKTSPTKSSCNNINNVPLFVEFTDDTVEVGKSVRVAIRLANSFLQANDVYGIAYTLHYDKELIDSNTINIDYSNSGLKKNTQEKIVYLSKPFFADGNIKSAVSRIDRIGKDFPSGPLGIIDFVMEDNLAQKTTLYDWLHFHFTDVFLIKNDETIIPVCAFSDSIVVFENVSGVNDIKNDGIEVFPNPASNTLYIKHKFKTEAFYQLLNAMGQKINTFQKTESKGAIIDISHLNKGIYFLQITNNEQTIVTKIEKF